MGVRTWLQIGHGFLPPTAEVCMPKHVVTASKMASDIVGRMRKVLGDTNPSEMAPELRTTEGTHGLVIFRRYTRMDTQNFRGARWAPRNSEYSHNPYNWPYKWIIPGSITPVSGVINLLITGETPHLANWLGYLSHELNRFLISKKKLQYI